MEGGDGEGSRPIAVSLSSFVGDRGTGAWHNSFFLRSGRVSLSKASEPSTEEDNSLSSLFNTFI